MAVVVGQQLTASVHVCTLPAYLGKILKLRAVFFKRQKDKHAKLPLKLTGTRHPANGEK